MSKVFLFFSFVCTLFAGEPNFVSKQIFELAKNQKAFLHITEKSTQIKESFEFSWTLYDGLNLVIHSRWRNYPKQFTLSTRKGLELYSYTLFHNRQNPYIDEVKVYLEFLSFENNKAKIQALILDEEKRIDVEFLTQGQNGQNR